MHPNLAISYYLYFFVFVFTSTTLISVVISHVFCFSKVFSFVFANLLSFRLCTDLGKYIRVCVCLSMWIFYAVFCTKKSTKKSVSFSFVVAFLYTSYFGSYWHVCIFSPLLFCSSWHVSQRDCSKALLYWGHVFKQISAMESESEYWNFCKFYWIGD